MTRKSNSADEFKAVRPMIVKLVRQFHRKYPHLDYDECLGRANLAFVHTYRSHDDSRGVKLSTRVHRRVQGTLLDYLREEVRKTPLGEVDGEPVRMNKHPLMDLFAIPCLFLSSDAKLISMLILSGFCETSSELGDMLKEMEWDPQRVSWAFSELSSS